MEVGLDSLYFVFSLFEICLTKSLLAQPYLCHFSTPLFSVQLTLLPCLSQSLNLNFQKKINRETISIQLTNKYILFPEKQSWKKKLRTSLKLDLCISVLFIFFMCQEIWDLSGVSLSKVFSFSLSLEMGFWVVIL